MAYINTVRRLIVEGGEFPRLKARIWMITQIVEPPPSQRSQDIFEEVEATGAANATFTLPSGPSLLDETGKLCGLSIHEEGLANVDGPLFRFGDIATLPTPFPADPNGYIDCTELPPVTIDVSTADCGTVPGLSPTRDSHPDHQATNGRSRSTARFRDPAGCC
jgi:hypothetical protein